MNFWDFRPRLCVKSGRICGIKRHCRGYIFFAAIDTQLQELNRIFNKHTMGLKLSLALDPRNNFKAFSVEDIYRLVKKFYPEDFTEQEKIQLEYQLKHYKSDVSPDSKSTKLLNYRRALLRIVQHKVA